jgi:2'-5' RNA ligase
MRAFVGIPIPHEIRRGIGEAVRELGRRVGGVKWVEVGNFHITLKFLGEIDESMSTVLSGSLRDATEKISSFTASLEGIGAFPSLSSPRVIWIGVEEGNSMVRKLQVEVDTELEGCGFQREKKPFHPHVTVGRVKRGARDIRKDVSEVRCSFGSFSVDQICLFKSTLTRSGPIYDIIGEVPLG